MNTQIATIESLVRLMYADTESATESEAHRRANETIMYLRDSVTEVNQLPVKDDYYSDFVRLLPNWKESWDTGIRIPPEP